MHKYGFNLIYFYCFSVIKCDDPGFVTNSKRDGYEFTYNSTVSYNCDHGYKPEGLPSIICTDKGKWNRNKPKCVAIQCPEIVVDDINLRIDYSDKERLVDSEAVPVCEKGYRLIGGKPDNPMFCKWPGKWSHENLPRCERIFCTSPSKHSALSVTPRKDKYTIGDSIFIRCFTRSKVKTSAKCLEDGNWSGLPICPPVNVPKFCPPIPKFENGIYNATESKQEVNTIVIFRCHSNYLLQGANRIYCQPNGHWTSNPPFCTLSKELMTEETKTSPLSYVITSIIVTLILILLIISLLFYRWRKRKLQRKHWRRYFGSYSHRQSKTNIYHNHNQEMKLYKQDKPNAHPVTDL